jgi:hypothetical protein
MQKGELVTEFTFPRREARPHEGEARRSFSPTLIIKHTKLTTKESVEAPDQRSVTDRHALW